MASFEAHAWSGFTPVADLGTSLVFAAIAGVLTVASPCALPVVPLVVGAGLGGGRRRLVGMAIGFAGTFVVVTILLASTLAALGVTTAQLRIVAALALAALGATIAIPALGRRVERSRLLTSATARAQGARPRGDGLAAGIGLGAAIGVIWAPCVGPIMAAAIAVSIAAGPSADAVLIASAYALGAVVPLAAIALAGRRATRLFGPARWRAQAIRAFGVATLAAGLVVATGLDVPLQTAATAILPPGWGTAIAGVGDAGSSDAGSGDPASGGGTTVLDPVANVDGRTLPAPVSTALPGPLELADLGAAPELAGITSWINSEPLTMASLRGKVVLVHFWTFACSNCKAVQPYVKAWYDRYADAGFVVVGVHTPELSFEREIANVRDAVADQGVEFPVAFDPAFATWRAYENGAWPAFHYVDREGRIRYARGGEGDYERSEQVIRQLLAGG